jgi:hypothetical protein
VGRWWPDGNPLRRRTDRVEAVIVAVLAAILVVVGPLGAVAAGHLAYHAAARAELAGHADRYRVTALVLTGSAYQALPALSNPGLARARAQWTAPDGIKRHGTASRPTRLRGEIAVVPGTPAGSTVSTWVDASGQPAGAPQPGWLATCQALLAGVLACAVTAFLVSCAWLLARCWLDRRRLAAWAAAWRSTAPRWTTPR